MGNTESRRYILGWEWGLIHLYRLRGMSNWQEEVHDNGTRFGGRRGGGDNNPPLLAFATSQACAQASHLILPSIL